MKNLIWILFLLVSGLTNGQESIDFIFKAIEQGDVRRISDHLHPRAEVHIGNKVSAYNKSKSVAALNQFYRQNKPIEYKKIHRGTPKDKNSQYTIGKLITSNGEFRVYLYIERINNKLSVQEIRFDRD